MSSRLVICSRHRSKSRFPFGAFASPRPLLLIAPTHDRYARVADVRATVAAVPGVTLDTPMDFNRFGRKFQARVLDWLAGNTWKSSEQRP
jgi:hypothetical protein